MHRDQPSCYRCCGVGHISRYCYAPEKCVWCAGEHDSRTCPHRAPPTVNDAEASTSTLIAAEMTSKWKCPRCSEPHPRLLVSSNDPDTIFQFLKMTVGLGTVRLCNVYSAPVGLIIHVLPTPLDCGIIYIGDFNARHPELRAISQTPKRNGVQLLRYMRRYHLTRWDCDGATHSRGGLMLNGRLDPTRGRLTDICARRSEQWRLTVYSTKGIQHHNIYANTETTSPAEYADNLVKAWYNQSIITSLPADVQRALRCGADRRAFWLMGALLTPNEEDDIEITEDELQRALARGKVTSSGVVICLLLGLALLLCLYLNLHSLRLLPEISDGERVITLCTQYIYLGAPVQIPRGTPGQRVHPLIIDLLGRFEKRFTPLRTLATRGKGISIPLARTIYVTFICSVIDYLSPALIQLPKTSLYPLDKFQNKVMRFILGCSSSTRIVNMLSELKLPFLVDRIHSNVASFTIRSLCTPHLALHYSHVVRTAMGLNARLPQIYHGGRNLV
ncbi:hypothetical protein E2C01_041378 [Portunus trituberculatus]|uniref:CCHC-type domain-containing protein n=1 Tax=Portunus trituberculatus TaxID=210409 RepID=A0A5B7FQ98_PORTR|nr:hypothetical protein [Portunus trituberculatus]